MDDYTALLQTTTLFSGLDGPELEALLRCLAPVRRSFGRGESLLRAGEPGGPVGVVLAGSIEAYRAAPDGARVLMAQMGPGGVFGDVLGGSSLASPVTVTAAAPCTVLFFSYQRLLAQCGQGCPAHARLMQNLVRTVSDKYFALAHRIELLMLKSLRAKICAYLLAEAARAGADTFTIRYTRAQLSEYLGCDRSALSRELSRMQADGLIATYKSSFKLLDLPALQQLCHT